MELVNNNIKYWDFIRNLRNDKRVNSGFIEDTYVSEKQQIEYMKKYSSCYRIALIDGNPVGYVGVIDNDIRICTHPDYQGMGVGKFMLNNCMKIWPLAIINATALNTTFFIIVLILVKLIIVKKLVYIIFIFRI